MKSESLIWIYVTAPNRQEARNIARRLVNDSLLACANVYGEIDSIYRWQGDVCEETEAAIFGKTTADRLEDIKALLPTIHSYECPCLVTGKINDGLPSFLAWISEQVRPPTG